VLVLFKHRFFITTAGDSSSRRGQNTCQISVYNRHECLKKGVSRCKRGPASVRMLLLLGQTICRFWRWFRNCFMAAAEGRDPGQTLAIPKQANCTNICKARRLPEKNQLYQSWNRKCEEHIPCTGTKINKMCHTNS